MFYFRKSNVEKSDTSNNFLNRENIYLDSPIGLDLEENKSKSPPKTLYDSFINLKNMSIYHSLEEILVKTHTNKPFPYFEPVLVSFTDANFMKFNNCLLCGAFSNSSELINCRFCQENYHYYCVYSKNYKEERFIEIKSGNLEWLCPYCKLCEKCNKPPENSNNLFCQCCERFYHLKCAYKNINTMPGLSWKCENCFE